MSAADPARVRETVRAYYAAHPAMVSSPFGGIVSFDDALWARVCAGLGLDFREARVLDVGCGRGLVQGALAAQGARAYTGTDLVRSFDGVSSRIADFHLASAEALPFPDGRFTHVLCLDALEHFPDARAAAREMRRVLAPGGVLFLSVPNYRNVAGVVKWCAETLGRAQANTWAPFGGWAPQAHEAFMTPGRVRRGLAAAGFGGVRRIAFEGGVLPGVFPWVLHPRFPAAWRIRLERRGRLLWALLARAAPSLSLELFWRAARVEEGT